MKVIVLPILTIVFFVFSVNALGKSGGVYVTEVDLESRYLYLLDRKGELVIYTHRQPGNPAEIKIDTDNLSLVLKYMIPDFWRDDENFVEHELVFETKSQLERTLHMIAIGSKEADFLVEIDVSDANSYSKIRPPLGGVWSGWVHRYTYDMSELPGIFISRAKPKSKTIPRSVSEHLVDSIARFFEDGTRDFSSFQSSESIHSFIEEKPGDQLLERVSALQLAARNVDESLSKKMNDFFNLRDSIHKLSYQEDSNIKFYLSHITVDDTQNSTLELKLSYDDDDYYERITFENSQQLFAGVEILRRALLYGNTSVELDRNEIRPDNVKINLGYSDPNAVVLVNGEKSARLSRLIELATVEGYTHIPSLKYGPQFDHEIKEIVSSLSIINEVLRTNLELKPINTRYSVFSRSCRQFFSLFK